MKALSKTFTGDLQQKNPVITFVEGIYCDAKRIQWSVSPELDHIVVRLGGFHRAKNFMGLIGKRMEESGLEDIWSESGVYGPSVASKLLKATHYNRAVRAHKLTCEALERICWKSFVDWLEREGHVSGVAVDSLKNKKTELLEVFQQGHAHAMEH
jgi:hypothetical protein